ncbi:HPP family protein [Hymenobacter sp. UYP22]|uniref:HPP family protein n=1 Tax=Hymenobacter sp. UYP22 TaxID=3156348 RepID=UPI00339A3CB1
MPTPTSLVPGGRPRLPARAELLLALLPTVMILLMLWLLETLSNQRLLFASLASSAFLIYLDPGHRANSTRTLLISQLGAAVLGYGCHALLGPSYTGAALALVAVILVMITLDAMHPPAVATALNFAFRAGSGEGNLLLFGLAVGLVVVLLLVQQGSVLRLRRLSVSSTSSSAH